MQYPKTNFIWSQYFPVLAEKENISSVTQWRRHPRLLPSKGELPEHHPYAAAPLPQHRTHCCRSRGVALKRWLFFPYVALLESPTEVNQSEENADNSISLGWDGHVVSVCFMHVCKVQGAIFGLIQSVDLERPGNHAWGQPCSGFPISGRCPHPRFRCRCEAWSRWRMGDGISTRVRGGAFPLVPDKGKQQLSPERRRDFQAFPIHQPLAIHFFCPGVGFLEKPAERGRERRLSHIMHFSVARCLWRAKPASSSGSGEVDCYSKHILWRGLLFLLLSTGARHPAIQPSPLLAPCAPGCVLGHSASTCSSATSPGAVQHGELTARWHSLCPEV